MGQQAGLGLQLPWLLLPLLSVPLLLPQGRWQFGPYQNH
jgi:hypothetical protein